MKNCYIYPYSKVSKSAKLLSKTMKVKRIKLINSKFKPSNKKVVINYGSSQYENVVYNNCKVINDPYYVAVCSNKLKFFNNMINKGINLPEFTTEIKEASEWIKQGHLVFCRTVLTGHSGEGIVLANNLDELVPCKLYVKEVKKKQEYRVHVINNKIVLIQRKARRKDIEEVNWKIRNHKNGFVFCINDVGELPEDLEEQALLAYKCSSLEFCAVDIIYNEKQNKCYVLEINTAPGLQGTTLEIYSKELLKLAEEIQNV